jgi:hypothetical protein
VRDAELRLGALEQEAFGQPVEFEEVAINGSLS